MPLLAFHGDYDFSFVTPFTEVTQRFGHFAQLIGSVVPDNVHMGSDGSLITAGMVIDDPVCGSVQSSDEFDLEEFAACPRPFIAKAIDPQSMEGRDLVTGPANEHFSNATMALQVGNDIWIGTFSGDRIGYRSLKQHD